MLIIAALFIAVMVFLAIAVWPAMPVPSVVLVVLAAAGSLVLYKINVEMFKKTLTVTAVILAAMLVAWYLLLSTWVNLQVVSEVEVLNPEGDKGTALVVYHPGKSDFQEKVNHAFAEGLVSNGWRMEITTASSQAPTDLSNYDLLVLGAPTYDWAPAKRTQRYLKGLGDLGGQPTVIIISGAGSTDRSVSIMEKLVQEANGNLVKSLPLWTMAPNEEMYGISDPVEIATQAGKEIPLPAK